MINIYEYHRIITKLYICIRNYIKDMNELPIVVISKELKYMLSQQKVKTLEKAKEIKDSITDETKRKNIELMEEKYQKIKNNVFQALQKVNKDHLVKGESSEQQLNVGKRKVQKMYQFLLKPCLCQIYGAKGTGKTSLLLDFLQKFIEIQKQNKNGGSNVHIFNGSSGITHKRMTRIFELKEQNCCSISYFDCAYMEDIIKVCSGLLQSYKEDKIIHQKKQIIIVDSMVSLLLGQEKTKPLVCKLFKIFNQLYKNFGFTILFTNLVQHKFEIGNEELYNHASYHSQYHSEYLTNKIYLERPSKDSGVFRGIELKTIKSMKFWFEIGEQGVQRTQSQITN